MSLSSALTDVVRALNAMSEVQTSEKHGLVPAEVTVTFQLSAGEKKEGQTAVEVLPLGAVSMLGASYTAEATSSGVPKRRNGISGISDFLNSSGRPSVMSVVTNPGATTLQVMFPRASSLATDLVKPMIPALLAA